jgi:hypothetical protein
VVVVFRDGAIGVAFSAEASARSHRTPESNSIAMVVQAPRWTLALTGKAVGAGALSMFSGAMV